MAKKDSMQETVEKGEQMALIDVGPKNLKEISPHARAYKVAMQKRLKYLAIETTEKQAILALVKEAKLKRLPDGSIKFHCDGLLVTVTPTKDVIKIKEDEE